MTHCSQPSTCAVIVWRASDPDNDDVTAFKFNLYNGNSYSSFARIDSFTGDISAVADSDNVGVHLFNVSVDDSAGATGWHIIKIEIKSPAQVGIRK